MWIAGSLAPTWTPHHYLLECNSGRLRLCVEWNWGLSLAASSRVYWVEVFVEVSCKRQMWDTSGNWRTSVTGQFQLTTHCLTLKSFCVVKLLFCYSVNMDVICTLLVPWSLQTVGIFVECWQQLAVKRTNVFTSTDVVQLMRLTYDPSSISVQLLSYWDIAISCCSLPAFLAALLVYCADIAFVLTSPSLMAPTFDPSNKKLTAIVPTADFQTLLSAVAAFFGAFVMTSRLWWLCWILYYSMF